MKKTILIITLISILALPFTGCDLPENGTYKDNFNTKETVKSLQLNQPTPTDIDYSLERYNLMRRAYWVNGQREKARTLPCEIADVPLGYAVLFTNNGSVVGKFIVEGKVTSLNSYLTPDSEYIASGGYLADIDGSYGENDSGIFFFTPDGKYVEWTGTYLYSDIPFEIADTVIKVVTE